MKTISLKDTDAIALELYLNAQLETAASDIFDDLIKTVLAAVHKSSKK